MKNTNGDTYMQFSENIILWKNETRLPLVVEYKVSTKSKIWETIASGDNGVEETLLSIPNRKVKLYSANGTAWVTVWESKTLPGY